MGLHASVAQMAEQETLNLRVGGSSPSRRTMVPLAGPDIATDGSYVGTDPATRYCGVTRNSVPAPKPIGGTVNDLCLRSQPVPGRDQPRASESNVELPHSKCGGCGFKSRLAYGKQKGRDILNPTIPGGLPASRHDSGS